MEIKPDRLKELFEVVKQSLIERPNIQQSGICREIKHLFSYGVISIQEKDYLSNYLLANKPNDDRYSEFMDYPNWIGLDYWWVMISVRPETKQLRINFLNALISNIK